MATTGHATSVKAIEGKKPAIKAVGVRRPLVVHRPKPVVAHHGPVPGKLYTDGVPPSERVVRH